MVVEDSGSGASRKMQSSWGAWFAFTLAGASAFWVANLFISLTPAAAAYRSAMSISYAPMLVQAAVGGLILAGVIAALLILLPGGGPRRGPVVRALVFAACALVVVTLLLEAPTKLTAEIDDPIRWLVVATVINAIRVLGLGLAIGLVARARETRASQRASRGEERQL